MSQVIPIAYVKDIESGQRVWPITHINAVRDENGNPLSQLLPEKAFGKGVCSTAAATQAKAVTISDYVFGTGSVLMVKFTNGIAVSGATLAVTYTDKNNQSQTTSAIPLYYGGAALADGRVRAGQTVVMQYNGTQLEIVGALEKKAPVFEHTYTAVTSTTGKNPSEEGWYEESGGVYTLTSDSTPVEGKTYYTQNSYYKMIY